MSQIVDFKFESPTGKTPNTIQHMTEVKSFIVAYADGEGKDQVRICFRPVDGQSTYVLNERISGSFVATSANKWFHNEMTKKLSNPVSSPVESI